MLLLLLWSAQLMRLPLFVFFGVEALMVSLNSLRAAAGADVADDAALCVLLFVLAPVALLLFCFLCAHAAQGVGSLNHACGQQ